VDRAAAGELGLTVVRMPAYSPHAVAEHTVALLLALNRKIHRAYNRVREQNFSLSGLVGFDLHGKTIGIAGTGKIGRVTAQIFRGFGCRVLAHDPHPMLEWATEHGVSYTGVETLLACSRRSLGAHSITSTACKASRLGTKGLSFECHDASSVC